MFMMQSQGRRRAWACMTPSLSSWKTISARIVSRHWFCTHLFRAGMRREYIKELRGDSRKEAFDLYNHIELKEA
jgi:site-specific recombinase XerD